MKAITWEEMLRLQKTDLGPFKATFMLYNPIDQENELAFGTFRVVGFNNINLPIIKCDGQLEPNVSAETIWCELK